LAVVEPTIDFSPSIINCSAPWAVLGRSVVLVESPVTLATT
jgi:hypothetical protein